VRCGWQLLCAWPIRRPPFSPPLLLLFLLSALEVLAADESHAQAGGGCIFKCALDDVTEVEEVLEMDRRAKEV